MTAKHTPATVTNAEMLASWMQDPTFRAEYERLQGEEGSQREAALTQAQQKYAAALGKRLQVQLV